ncbi:uncharacterized protein LOC135710403 [Ochlerotatus camptorhynchus]|uniref:uncharacterized protein LOC135710403 n=1 Tax=Ochlerotatus camptorhynchus TaxID=644619 RepID=UPI0031D53129
MEAAMRVSSRKTVLLFGIINLLLPNGAFSNKTSMFPQDFPNQPCDLANGKEGVCVYGYLCHDSIINIDGNGVIDLRFSDVCEDYFLKCCSKETPCLENTGTCVPASNCGANLDEHNNKKFKQTDECDWSGYKCCPNDKIGKSKESNQTDKERCDLDSLCVPHDQCKVNPDGDGLLESRSSDCSSPGYTCCPESMIKAPSTVSSDVQINSIEQYEACDDHTVCVSDDQCLVKPDGVNIIQKRVSVCSGRNQTCCPRDKVKGTDPCSEVGGTCIQGNSCPNSSSLQMDLRISQCEESGYVCCMQDSTDGRDQFINKTCSGGSGKCTPKKQCRGTTYRDRNKECGGLACCATLPTTTPSTSVFTRTTRKPVDIGNEGKACYNRKGSCRIEGCLGKKYSDTNNNCGGLNCCAEIQFELETEPPVDPVPCNSIGGKCMLDGNCHKKTDFPAYDCEQNEVCCLTTAQGVEGGSGSDELIKDCGYRNENGVKFGTTGREDGESQFGEFPWMVAIMVNEKGKVRFTCGGSLIDPEIVLTSAECVKSFRRTPDKLIVRAGEWDMGSTREPIPHEERRVTKIKSHPDFKASTLVNNIALLFLDDKFDQGSTINTVCLPPQNFVIDNGEVIATGWGSTPQDRTNYQQILKSIDLQYVQRSECERVLRKGTKNRSFKLHRSFICAGGVAGFDTCIGDAGSPIVHLVPHDFEFRYYAVGMVSWGVGCGRAGMPAAYTDIAFFRDWIDNEMEQEGLHAHYYTYTKQEEDEDEQ